MNKKQMTNDEKLKLSSLKEQELIHRESMEKLLLEEYKVLEADYQRIQQFRHSMGLFLLAASGVIWAFACNELPSNISIIVLVPALLSLGSLIWIVRYVPFVEDKAEYVRGVIAPWFGAGRGYFAKMAKNQFRIEPLTHDRLYSRWLAFFFGFPFQHIIILTSIAMFILLNKSSSLIEKLMIMGVAILFEILLLVLYLRVSRLPRDDRRFWFEFRQNYNGPCPDSFKPQSWEC